MSTKALEALSQVYSELSLLYAQEGRPDGDEAAAILAEASRSVSLPAAPTEPPLKQALVAVLQESPLPVASHILSALPLLEWHYSSVGGRIRQDVSVGMMSIQLVGPEGPVVHETIKIGLFFQGANVNYTTRSHSAEETFIMLAGQGLWQSGDNPAQELGVGAVIHHPSYMPHASQTVDKSLVAAYRWSGDTSPESYVMK